MSLVYLLKQTAGVSSACVLYCLKQLETYIQLLFSYVLFLFLKCDYPPEVSEMEVLLHFWV